MRKLYSFEIRTLHRQEIRLWKNLRLRQSLGRASRWKALQNMIHTTAGQAYASQPPLDEFADALATIFSGNQFFPDRPAALTETNWTLDELRGACARLKVNKVCDESGLAAALLQHAPDEFLVELLRLFNGILHHGNAPAGWKKTLFTMLPKRTRAKLVKDFRPIANIRLFYKVFAYMVLARVEQSLESFQPEAQHGFRSGRRMEEHVLTTNLVLDKSTAAGLPLWIISLDLSKAFDTVNWETLWEALRRQNISNQLIWILHCLYHNQTGVVRDGAGDSRTFDIFSGVRQGCVLSPRLFCAALELAMSEWRLANPHGGVDLGDAMPRLLDLRFADDILIFANTKEEVQNLLDSEVRHLATAGLVLNTSKTVALTREAQPPSLIQVGDSHMIKVLGYSESHKWLGCMLSASPGLDSDVEYHLQQAAKAFQKHRWMLQCKDCSIKHRLRYFEAVVSSTACFAAEHRPLYRKHLEKYDVALWGLHRAQIGQHNGMIFCMSGICAWITGPIASLRLLYKIFAYLMLGRMENTLENSQPEEQHGFRKQRRIEHLLTANLCLLKTLAANIPSWIISLDLSKAFDKVNWEALWAALMQHGVSQHLVWILQCIYYGQSGKVREDLVDSPDFGIRAGVRQGCVLTPRLFCAVLEFAMSSWRAKVETYGLNLHDGMKALLDLRFADDLLVFATSRDDTIRLLEELVTSLGQVGLKLNTSKTKILTTQAQPGSSLETSGGVTVEVLDSRCAHKWLGCMLQAAPGGNPSADLQHHLQAASRVFHANHSILTNHQVSVKDRLTFFHAVVTPHPSRQLLLVHTHICSTPLSTKFNRRSILVANSQNLILF